MNKTFFFYDLETSGLNPRADRIMQFAGQRTDENLEPLSEPVNLLVKMTSDALPSPGAIMVTKITPQMTLMDGISEAEFCKYVTEEIFVPETIALGYNTVRFDDEFMRATLWRNFYDPYEWEWKDGRSRWDLLDVVRLVRALRPEGINWPVAGNGKATNRLELLTKENGLSHEHAHDALSDVYATIAVAKLIREKQPEMFDYMLNMREKRQVAKLVNLENPKPFVYASGRYSGSFNKTTVAYPLTVGRNGNVLVYDLRHPLESLLLRAENNEVQIGAEKVKKEATDEKIEPEAHQKKEKNTLRNPYFPVVKELCLNKCPAVAPLGVLDKADGWAKIGLSKAEMSKNLETLQKHPDFAERMRTLNEGRPEFPPAPEPEQALYDGFLDERDKIKVAAVRNAESRKLADFHPDFADPRLPELLLHYKGRNFPEALSEDEAIKFEAYRRSRLERQSPGFIAELEKIVDKDVFVAEELKLYFESLR